MATKAAPAPETKATASKRIRKIFGNIHEVSEMPNLIEVQRESYEQFLRSRPQDGYVSGLEKRLRSVFPIRDFAGTAELDFVHYELEYPKYDTDECRQRGMTYAAPMRVTLRLIVFEVDPDTETRSVLDIKEQDVYMGDMPLMTKNGTFIVNGTERVIVSQMHRSPGVLFDHDRGKTHASGKFLFAARVIPYRGSWLDFEFDAKDIVNVRIDRKRKLPVTALLHALDMSNEEILNTFYGRVTFVRGKNGWQIPYVAENWRGQKPAFDVVNGDTGEVVFTAGTKITPRAANKATRDELTRLVIPTEEIFGRYSAYDLINEKTGEIYIEAGDEVSAENLEKLDKAGIDRIELLDIDHVATGAWMRNTLKADKSEDRDSALSDIYRVMRPGEPPTKETAEALFAGLFFDPERYDLSAVGRVKLNMRLDLDAEDTVTTLRKEDIVAVVKTLVDLKDGKGEIDDIDNLGNRRVRSVGELLENQYRVGLLRMERAVKERMSSVDVSTVMPNGLINSLASFSRVNKYGFIETPYRRVVDGKVTDEVVYLSAMEEAKHTIAQANAELNDDRSFAEEIISSRRNGDFLIAPREQITLMDVSPKQLVSVAASLIPFLENDDANRALMGSNMQRQAVPLIQADAPLVGTGMEETVARDSGAAIAARRPGVIDQVDATRIVIRVTGELKPGESGVDIYTLMKFQRSNQSTCINQRPLVKVGYTAEAGEIIADGPSTQFGELALGRNVLVAFMPWNGYNYEDSILISERIVKEDVFTSIHIEEFEVMARDTKLGPEDITRDIPNVGEEAPDVRDTSLRLPPGVSGTVVEVRVFNRHGIDIDDRTRAIQTEKKERLKKDADDERAILNRATFSRLKEMLLKQTATAAPKGIKKGSTLDEATLEGVERHDWWKIAVKNDKRQADIEALKGQYDEAVNVITS